MKESNLVSVNWLKENLDKDGLILLDASPASTAKGSVSSYQHLSIPSARRLDLKEKFTNKTSQFPNTAPSPAQFEAACQSLGINTNSEIVVYDNLGIYTSPRVWWLFKTMGHNNVKVLNGGLVEWINKGLPTVEKEPLNLSYPTGNFKSAFQTEYLVNFNTIVENIPLQGFVLVDARSEGRFEGTAPEPRKHLGSGHIPNSINIPYTIVLENGKFKSKETLRQIFESKIATSSKLVFSCGSGITACIVMLASELAFFKSSSYLYDGSWTEYATLKHL